MSEQKKNNGIKRIGEVWKLHFLWLLCSLPVITIGASTSALFYSYLKLRDGEDGNVSGNFFKAWKENLKQATILFLLYAAIGVGLFFCIVKHRWMADGGSGLLYLIGGIIVCIPYSLSLIYVFAVQSKFMNTVKNIVFYSFVLSIRHYKDTIAMILILAVVAVLCVKFIAADVCMLVFGAGLLMYIETYFFHGSFVEYIKASEEASGGKSEEN